MAAAVHIIHIHTHLMNCSRWERLHVAFHYMLAMWILLAVFQYNKLFCDTLGHLLNYKRGSFQCVCQSQNYYITAHSYQFAEANSDWQGPIPATPSTTINTHTQVLTQAGTE